MQALIFAGGFGTRINKDIKNKKLKPLIKVNNKEILLRIINIYQKNGVKEFILLGGYKYKDLENFSKKIKNLDIKTINTGLHTNTAGRLLLAKKYIKSNNFLLTYGDSIADFDLQKSIKKKNKKNFVFTVYKYKINYGVLKLKNSKINKIYEKSFEVPINAGFYVLDKRVFEYIKNKKESFEKKIIPKIIKSKKINISYTFAKNWYPMDTLDDKKKLEKSIK